MGIFAQTSDNAFTKPLKTVLSDIEKRFGITLSYPNELVAGKTVSYADWRFRPTVEETLANVLGPQDIVFVKEDTHTYRLRSFDYYQITPDEGRAQLADLAKRYTDRASWETRKANLRACMRQALHLDQLPPRPTSAPIITSKRTFDGYTVENVALETLPGLYVSGSLYRPTNVNGPVPLILNPHGHFTDGRYRADCQYRCAMQARLGAMAFSYDLFAWGESGLQFKLEDHRRSIAQIVQILNGIRLLDWLLTLPGVDKNRVAVTGGSGGGSQAMLLTALDDRLTLSMPVVMMSSYYAGGCPCESGMGTQLCGNGTNNVEVAAMAAPRPQLIVSDGKDWTQHVPDQDFPYLQRIYTFYNAAGLVQNVHLPNDGHDYGPSKRLPTYDFLAKHFQLDRRRILNKAGQVDESRVTIEPKEALYVFGNNGEKLPANAIRSFAELENIIPH